MSKIHQLIGTLCAVLALTVAAPAAHAQNVNYVDKTGTTSITTVATTLCVAPLNTAVATMQSTGWATEAVTITGTWTGTISWYGYSDGGQASTKTWLSQLGTPQAGGAPVASTTANGTWFIPTAGYEQVCVEASAAMTGTAVVTQRLTLRERPGLYTTGTPFQCSYASTSTTSIQLTGCAIQAGLSYYITGISLAGDATTSATNPATIQSGTGSNCATGTASVYAAHHVALSSVTWVSPNPIKAAQGAALCLLDASTGSKYVTVVGFTAP